jgi:hypothetical protein
MAEEKTRDFLGLPLFRRMYGFGDVLTLRARMVTAAFARVDRAAIAGALPRHPKVRLHPASPLLLVQSDFLHCADNGDPLAEDRRYREVMLACLLEGTAGLFGPMWPLVLYLDDPAAMCAGREFYGFPKVPARVSYEADGADVRYVTWPRGAEREARVLSTRWSREPSLVGRALGAVGEAVAGAVRAAGVDGDTVDAFAQLALAPAGEVWNLHQIPDLANPRRASLSRLTRFKPSIVDPSDLSLLDGFVLDLPRAHDEPAWSLGKRFFGAGDGACERKPVVAFRWEATMHASTGVVLDEWR